MEKLVFAELNSINVNDKTEKKNGLTYLSWSWAWGEVKKRYADVNYKVYENTLPNGYVVNYFTDGRTSYVKVGVSINGIEHIEELPVMDFKNKSIVLEQMTSFDVNKAIQRCLTKAIARFGLGLYIYAGEDLPEDDNGATKKEDKSKSKVEQNVSNLKKDLYTANDNQYITKEQIEIIKSKLTAEEYLTLVEKVGMIETLSLSKASEIVSKLQAKR